MPTPAERQALVFLAAVAALGGAVRVVGANRFVAQAATGEQLVAGRAPGPLGARALASQIAAVDSAQQAKAGRSPRARNGAARARAGATRNPLDSSDGAGAEAPSPPLVVNLNQSTVRELERLPRVGPALAGRIIAWREAHGPFRSLDDLRHVRGIGPVTAALLAPSVTF